MWYRKRGERERERDRKVDTEETRPQLLGAIRQLPTLLVHPVCFKLRMAVQYKREIPRRKHADEFMRGPKRVCLFAWSFCPKVEMHTEQRQNCCGQVQGKVAPTRFQTLAQGKLQVTQGLRQYCTRGRRCLTGTRSGQQIAKWTALIGCPCVPGRNYTLRAYRYLGWPVDISVSATPLSTNRASLANRSMQEGLRGLSQLSAIPHVPLHCTPTFSTFSAASLRPYPPCPPSPHSPSYRSAALQSYVELSVARITRDLVWQPHSALYRSP